MVKAIKQRQEEAQLTFVWRHPKFYKRATNCRSDNKPQKGDEDEQQATSDKQQASSDKRPETEQTSHEDS